jgi:hypothetical protein
MAYKNRRVCLSVYVSVNTPEGVGTGAWTDQGDSCAAGNHPVGPDRALMGPLREWRLGSSNRLKHEAMASFPGHDRRPRGFASCLSLTV